MVIETEPEALEKVGMRLSEFEGVVQETQLLRGKPAILARVITDSQRRFREFLREQIKSIQGVKRVQDVLV